jgi:adenylate kinase
MIIFLGIAGSGKSVQCKMLAEYLSCSYISVGELLRQSTDTANREKMAEGELLPDQVVIEVVDQAMVSIPKDSEFIIDGFPRSFKQSKWVVKTGDADTIRVIHIKIEQSEAIRRLKLRSRRDDNEIAIKKRIAEYIKLIDPVLDEFSRNNIKVFEVDGSRPINEVNAHIIATLINDGVRKN